MNSGGSLLWDSLEFQAWLLPSPGILPMVPGVLGTKPAIPQVQESLSVNIARIVATPGSGLNSEFQGESQLRGSRSLSPALFIHKEHLCRGSTSHLGLLLTQ